MKFNLLSFIMAMVLMLTCTACPSYNFNLNKKTEKTTKKIETITKNEKKIISNAKKTSKAKATKNNQSKVKNDSIESSLEQDEELALTVTPTGDPEKDAKACEEALEEYYLAMYNLSETETIMIEYYAENEDLETYRELENKFLLPLSELTSQLKKEKSELEARINKARTQINSHKPNSGNNNYAQKADTNK